MAVRRESVRLSLEDDFTRGMLEAAASTKTLERALKDLDGTTVNLGDSTDSAAQSTREMTREQAIAQERAKRTNAALREEARAALDAEQGMSRATGSTKRYTFETALAEQRASRLRSELRKQANAALDAERGIANLGDSASVSGREVDRLSGRLRIFADAAAVLGPSLVPIGAIAVPAVAGLAGQFGFAALAAGTAVAAFQGVGKALEAVNKAALEPTEENLEAARKAMELLSPAGRNLVREMQSLRPVLQQIRDTGQEQLFPGVIEGFEALERMAPRVDSLVGTVAGTLGDLFAEGAESLASDRFADFFAMLEHDAPRVLADLGSAIGSIVHGMSELWEDFAPLNRDFGSWLADTAASFDDWADGLNQTAGFQEFIAYIRENGPRVADAMSALSNAVIQVVEAVAPLGGPSLKIIETFANAIAAIADSDLGTPIFGAVAALALLNRTLQVTASLQTRITGSTALAGGLAAGGVFGAMGAGARSAQTSVRKFTDALLYVPTAQERALRGTERWTEAERQRQAAISSGLGTMARAGAATAALVASTTGLSDSVGLSNTAMGAMVGSVLPGWGTAAGAAAGFALDLASANDGITQSLKNLDAQIAGGGSLTTLHAGLTTAHQDLTEFNSGIEDIHSSFSAKNNPFDSRFWDVKGQLADAKNTWEGIFGKSDAEEAKEQYDEAARSLQSTEDAARGLAAAMGVNIFGTQTAQLQQLDQVIQQAQPAMAQLGITFQDLANSFKFDQGTRAVNDFFGTDLPTDQYDRLRIAIVRAMNGLPPFTDATWKQTQAEIASKRAKEQQRAEMERVRQAVAAEREAIQQSAAQWGDYSQKIKVATGPSLDDVIRRMGRITEAVENQAENIRTALNKGVDPEAIANLFDTLGPQGAALALDDLANAGKGQVKQFNAAFGTMSDSVDHLARAIENVHALISGDPLSINPKHAKNDLEQITESVDHARESLEGVGSMPPVTPKVRVDDKGVDPTLAGIDRALVHTGAITAKPRADLDDQASARIDHVGDRLEDLDGSHATTTITTVHVDEYGDSHRSPAQPIGESPKKPTAPPTPKVDPKVPAFLKGIDQSLAHINGIVAVPKVRVDAKAVDPTLRGIDRGLAHTDGITATPRADLNDAPFQGKNKGVRRQLQITDGIIVIPVANLNDNASGPLRGVLGLLHQADGFHASSTITITTNHVSTFSGSGGSTLDTHQSVNGHGGRSARGGEVPDDGGPYSDRFPYLLAPRERITSDMFGQATKSRRLLDLINEGRISDRNLFGGRVVAAARGTESPVVGTWQTRASERPAGGSSTTTTVIHHHVHEVQLRGEMDFEKAKGHIDKRIVRLSAAQINEDRDWRRTQGG